VLDKLFRWADVVHHNSRVGLSEKLGYDEATARGANPALVYSFASGFGETGPKALLPTNDQLMQALAGIEAGQGGFGAAPTYLVWGAVDVTGGWVAACGVLAALYARKHGGGGQSVSSSLLGAAMTLKSGAEWRGDQLHEGPVLDPDQLGYGAAYRIYRCADGWLALAADQEVWRALGMPGSPPPLRTDGGDKQPEELVLEAVFATKPVAEWRALLGDAVEPVVEADRETFIARFLDDPINRELGRIVEYQWGDRGRLEQPALPIRFGPGPRPEAPRRIPGLGEHIDEILRSLGR
jgi:crotonobetainyl-CoA:carnitine CoA-transferase CaiB-like acyl-CoA transferase